MILIADGGSTKTNWCLVTDDQKKVLFNTEGYNPYFVSEEYITKSLKENLPKNLEIDQIAEVNYYGAGCSTDEMRAHVQRGMQPVFTKAKVNIGHDLLAAWPRHGERSQRRHCACSNSVGDLFDVARREAIGADTSDSPVARVGHVLAAHCHVRGKDCTAGWDGVQFFCLS